MSALMVAKSISTRIEVVNSEKKREGCASHVAACRRTGNMKGGFFCWKRVSRALYLKDTDTSNCTSLDKGNGRNLCDGS